MRFFLVFQQEAWRQGVGLEMFVFGGEGGGMRVRTARPGAERPFLAPEYFGRDGHDVKGEYFDT